MAVTDKNVVAEIYADLAKRTVSPKEVRCVQYDADVKVIAVHLLENGNTWEVPEGYSANVRMTKSDGAEIYNSAQVEDSTVYITLTEQMCGVVGTQYFCVEIINGEDAAYTGTVALDVSYNPLQRTDFTSLSQYGTLDQAVKDAQAAAQEAASAAQEVVDENLANYYTKPESDERYYTKTQSDGRFAPLTAAIRATATGNPILVEDSAEAPMQGLYVYGKTTQDGTPSPESPVPLVSAGDDGEIDVTVCGVNMIDAREKVSRNTSGCTLTFDGRGGITINGTAVSDSADIYFIGSYASLKNAIPEGEKTLSTDGLSEDELIFFLYSAGAQESHVSGNKKLTTTRAANAAMVRLKNGKTYDNVTFYPMLNVGATALPWQPYTGKTITISTPNGLPGIPVDSGGNYTDSTGQQWICDEIDVEENKYIKRTFLQTLDENLNYTLNGTNNENLYQYVTYLTTSMDGTNSKALLSDRFAPGAQLGSSTEDPGLWIYGPNTLVIVVQKNIASTADELKQWFAANPTTVLLPLAEPEVSTITADQVNSYGGATTAYTTSGADLTMQYVADAQKYIDNKIGAISTAMLKE